MRSRHPLTVHFTGTGEREEPEWQEPDANHNFEITPPPSPSRDFAPRGPPKVRKRFRDRLAKPLQVDIPRLSPRMNLDDIHSHASPLFELLQTLLEAVTSSIDHARSIGFLERLRLAIVQSQLLDNPLILGLQPPAEAAVSQPDTEPSFHGLTSSGALAAAVLGFGVAFLIRWFWLGGPLPTWKRIFASTMILCAMFVIVRGYIRRQNLRNIQRQGLAEAANFFSLSRDLDCANSAALNFIMEVELVARGYRL
jgi:hypothetical protein